MSVRILMLVLMLAGSALGQIAPASQLVLDNDLVHVLRRTVPAGGQVDMEEHRDAVAVRLEDGSARFIAKGEHLVERNPTEHDVVEVVIELKRHWDAEVRPCAAPMNCTRETRAREQPISWATTLFTNGFVTATTHRVVAGGTVTSSYYSQHGLNRIVLVPLTDLMANFGGIDETLRAGQAYFSAATEVEITGKDAEARWFVLRLNILEQQ